MRKPCCVAVSLTVVTASFKSSWTDRQTTADVRQALSRWNPPAAGVLPRHRKGNMKVSEKRKLESRQVRVFKTKTWNRKAWAAVAEPDLKTALIPENIFEWENLTVENFWHSSEEEEDGEQKFKATKGKPSMSVLDLNYSSSRLKRGWMQKILRILGTKTFLQLNQAAIEVSA